MDRRAFLAAGAAGLAGLAGCFGSSGGSNSLSTNGDYPTDDDPADGYPPAFDDVPPKRSVDESSFETITARGQEVALVPLDVAHYWYRRREARFADARGQKQYRTSHIFGAVNSPAGENEGANPVLDWPRDDRVVCYCGCPHHLSSIRAATLQKRGYSRVFVIDEGFWAWHEAGYAMRGTNLSLTPAGYHIRGEVPARYAGQYAWALQPATDQREAAPIRDGGSYDLHLRFSGLTPSTPIVLRTPAYTLRAPLKRFTGDVVRG